MLHVPFRLKSLSWTRIAFEEGSQPVRILQKRKRKFGEEKKQRTMINGAGNKNSIWFRDFINCLLFFTFLSMHISFNKHLQTIYNQKLMS